MSTFDDEWKEKARVRELLESRGAAGATTLELHDVAVGGANGTRRVRSLRQDGLPVQRVKIPKSGYWRYWLGDPLPEAPNLFTSWEDEE